MAVHCLLIALLVVSSAFVKEPPKENVRFIKIFDASRIKLTDDETTGGGSPEAAPAVTPAAQQTVIQPVAAPPQPEPAKPKPVEPEPEPARPVVKPDPEPAKPVVKPEPERPKPTKPKPDLTAKTAKEPKKTVEDKKPEKPEPEKHVIKPNLTTRKTTVDPDAERRRKEKVEQARRERQEQRERERAEAEAQRKYSIALAEAQSKARQISAARQQAVQGVIGNVEKNLSGGANVEMPGPGGEAFVNYGEFIWSMYYQAWQTPEERPGVRPVRTEIVVNRDGNVISANIIGKSGDPAMDKSVRQALDRVRKFPPFPEGAKDATRTFRITFTLKGKHQLG